VLATRLLRADLLQGVSILVAGAEQPSSRLGDAVTEACTELGAHVHRCACEPIDEVVVEERVSAALLADAGSLDMLVVDGEGLFARGDLGACLGAAWNVTRAVFKLAFASDAQSLRRVVYLAPGTERLGGHVDAVCAGLENLSRTLSIEWARHGITLVTIVPPPGAEGEAAALTAYLASPAGAYFSGCLLDLRGLSTQSGKAA
jgi:hypothetical protein